MPSTPANSTDLPGDVIEAFAMIKDAMYPVCTIPSMGFPHMVEEQDLDHGDSFVQAVDIIVDDPS